jgi:tetratricopeptide (TPR) repeat protein
MSVLYTPIPSLPYQNPSGLKEHSIEYKLLSETEKQQLYDRIRRQIQRLEKDTCYDDPLKKAQLYKSIGHLDDANQCLYKALRNPSGYTEKTSPKTDILNRIGVIHRLQGSYPQAREMHKKALKGARRNDDKPKIHESRYYTGLVERELGNYGKAFQLFYECLDYFKTIEAHQKEARVLNSIANGYRIIGQNHLALEWYEKSLSLFTEMKDSVYISMVLNNMGIAYKNIKQYNKALTCYYRGLEIDKEHLQILRLSRKLNNIGYINIQLGEYNKAQTNLHYSLIIKKWMNSKADIALTRYNLGVCYARQRKYSQALQNLLKAYNTSRRLKKANLTRLTAEKISQLYYQQNDFQQAYNYKAIANEHRDSLYNVNKTMQIGFAATNYKLQGARVQSGPDIKRQHNLILLLIIGFTMILSIPLVLIILNQKKYSAIQSFHEQMRYEKQQLQKAFDDTKKQLHVNNLQLISKNQLLKDLYQRLNDLKSQMKTSHKASIQKLINELRSSSDEQLFEKIELLNGETQQFFKKLGDVHPSLTPNERKICALLKLNLSTKEISKITRQSPQSILMARSRLRKKLQIDRQENLTTFLMDL